ncbi:MAG: hypothetical protein FJX67_09905, partial [Alphaproteobacteria bacterium]|nr:hypothetical protein [Alphaproteobacteria bacterium]
SEAEPFWTGFLRRLRQRGLRGVKLVVSDAHVGLKAAQRAYEANLRAIEAEDEILGALLDIRS